MKIIELVGGEKGGIGKSLVTEIKYLIYVKKFGLNGVLLVDGDTTNPDIARKYENALKVDVLDLSDFSDLITEVMANNAIKICLISLPARAISVFIENKDLFEEIQSDNFDLKFEMPFILNTKDGVLLLSAAKRILDRAFDFSQIILNGFFGDYDDFSSWHGSSVKNGGETKISKFYFEPYSGKEIFLPNFRKNKLLENSIIKNNENLVDIEKNDKMQLLERLAIKRFVSDMTKLFDRDI